MNKNIKSEVVSFNIFNIVSDIKVVAELDLETVSLIDGWDDLSPYGEVEIVIKNNVTATLLDTIAFDTTLESFDISRSITIDKEYVRNNTELFLIQNTKFRTDTIFNVSHNCEPIKRYTFIIDEMIITLDELADSNLLIEDKQSYFDFVQKSTNYQGLTKEHVDNIRNKLYLTNAKINL